MKGWMDVEGCMSSGKEWVERAAEEYRGAEGGVFQGHCVLSTVAWLSTGIGKPLLLFGV